MKIYVVSDEAYEASNFLAKQLDRIVVQPNKATPVIVVDDFYNLDQLSRSVAPVTHTIYRLSNFEGRSANAGSVEAIDTNQIEDKLSNLTTEWVLFEFGQNDQATCIDFISKLARYNFMKPTLREKKVVFLVPEIYLAFFAKRINESFNNLPRSSMAGARSPQIGRLFISTNIERLFLNFRLLTSPLLQLIRLVKFIYRRFLHSV